MANRRIQVIAMLLGVVLLSCFTLANPNALDKPTGQPGRYTVKTSVPGFYYHVSADKNYDMTTGWGIQLMLRGKNPSMSDAWKFWEENILVSQRLIGVSMMFDEASDGSYSDDAMIRAAMEAFTVVQHTYQTLPGRGSIVVTLDDRVADTFFSTMRRQGLTKMANHIALYNVGLDRPIQGEPGLSLTLALSTDGWQRRGKYAPTGPVTAGNLAQWIAQRRSNPDAAILTGSNKRYLVDKGDIAESAKAFERSDLAYNTNIQPTAFKTPTARRIAQRINQNLQRGQPITSLIPDEPNKPQEQAELDKLKKLVDAHLEAVARIAKETADQDALVAAYYWPHWMKKLKGHPSADELAALKPDREQVQREAALRAKLGTVLAHIDTLREDDTAGKTEAAQALKQIAEAAQTGSLTHQTATGIASVLLK